MIELGKRQVLEVFRIKEFGVYMGESSDKEASILLPKRQVPEGCKIGDQIEVFVYKDSEDRMIATRSAVLIEVGELARLEVKEIGKIGAFLDMGLEKDLLLPFKEQTCKLRDGQYCLVALYVDKSHRLAATMKVYPYLRSDSSYQKDDKVRGTVYQINENVGVFVAIDECYAGLIPNNEVFETYHVGDPVEARVIKVREDGKLDLSPREKVQFQMDRDAQLVLKVIQEFDGALPFNDKASPEIIKKEFQLSKNAFKRAVGNLLKNGKIEITEKSIKLKQEEVKDEDSN